MGSQPWLLDFLLVLFLMMYHLLAALVAAQSPPPPPFCWDNGVNYTSNSVYDANLNSLLSSLSSNVDDNGFYNASLGQSPDRANAIVLCRGDVQLDRCRSCVQDATAALVRSCPNSKQGIAYDEFCTVRFSNVSIFGTLATSPVLFGYNPQNATSPDQFISDRGTLIRSLRDVAAVSGDSRRKVAFGVRNTSDSQTIYALVQCSPDLFSDNCSSCLTELDRAQGISRRGRSSVGARALGPSCNYRYEIQSFYNETRLREFLATPPESMPPQSTTRQGEEEDNSSRTIIIVVVSVVVFVLLVICVGIFVLKRIKKKAREENETVVDIGSADSLQFGFAEIKSATDDFSDANKLGEGGFGAVYKGKFASGQEIAVKRLSAESGQGDVEFKNEVLLMAKLQHRNLVRLLGFSIERKEKLLVYEFVKNTSLDQFLFDPTRRLDLGWDRRFKIIGGIARGLLYLHEESRLRIIHRDLKAANILLDDMNAKIADFGMARLFVADETQGSTSRIVGTYGYMSPEYAMHGQFSDKSDVFSFGVLILEIISGQKNNSFRRGENIEDLLSSAWKYWHQGTIEEIVDPVLRTGSNNNRDILRCIHIGLLCVQENPSNRPKMASVVLMLSSFTISLPVPSEPAFFAPNNYDSSISDSNSNLAHSTESSKNEVSVSELYPR